MITGTTDSRIRLQSSHSREHRISLVMLMIRSISHRYISHRTVQGIRILEEIIITETDSAITTAATEIMTVIMAVIETMTDNNNGGFRNDRKRTVWKWRLQKG